MKNPDDIQPPFDDDFILVVKNTWDALPEPKHSLEQFVKEYYEFEKELFYFLNSNHFYLESEKTTTPAQSNEIKQRELKRINELMEEISGIYDRHCRKYYRPFGQNNSKIEFNNKLNGKNNRKGGRDDRQFGNYYRKGGRYDRKSGRYHRKSGRY